MRIRLVMLTVIALLIVLPLISCGESEEKAFLTGVVMDENTRAPLPGVAVYLNDKLYETGSDARFQFAELVPGQTYSLKVSREFFEDYSKDIVAVYPSPGDQEILMKLMTPEKPQPSPIQDVTIVPLKSYDFDIKFGIDRKDISFKEIGSFIAPDKHKYVLTSKNRNVTPPIPGKEEENKEPEELKSSAIEIGQNQWIDNGEGYFKNDRFHPGYRDVWSLVNLTTDQANKALKKAMYVVDEGETTVSQHKVRRLRTLAIISEPIVTDKTSEKPQMQKMMVEMTISIIIEGELKGVPVEIDISTYRDIVQVRTWASVMLTNLNVPFAIDPPPVK